MASSFGQRLSGVKGKEGSEASEGDRPGEVHPGSICLGSGWVLGLRAEMLRVM